MEANQGLDPRKLQVGQSINLPAGGTAISDTTLGAYNASDAAYQQDLAARVAAQDPSQYIVADGMRIGPTIERAQALGLMEQPALYVSSVSGGMSMNPYVGDANAMDVRSGFQGAGGVSTSSGFGWNYDTASLGIHTTLAVAGSVPVVGVLADAADFLYTAAEIPFGKSTWGDLGLAAVGIGATLTPVGGDQAAGAAKIANRAARVADEAGALAPDVGNVVEGVTDKTRLLPTEGNVATYDELLAAGTKGDNITPHHIPSAQHMAERGVGKGEGVAINMEQPFPGVGGRHRETFTYGNSADVGMSSRDALAAGVWDARRIYRQDGLYDSHMRQQLQQVIQQNKALYPDIFRK